jgi:hypothetical protein
MDAQVRGKVDIWGTADAGDFDYYKLELGSGNRPRSWITLGDLHREPVVNGVLDVWDSTLNPRGVYVLRLSVVDNTGNYQTCEVRLSVSR